MDEVGAGLVRQAQKVRSHIMNAKRLAITLEIKKYWT